MKNLKNLCKKFWVVMTMTMIQFIMPLSAWADKNAPDLKDVNKDVNNLLNAPSWFKTAFYTIAGLFAFIGGSVGILKLLQARTEVEISEAKKNLGKIFALVVGIPIILRIIIAFVQWRFNVNLNF